MCVNSISFDLSYYKEQLEQMSETRQMWYLISADICVNYDFSYCKEQLEQMSKTRQMGYLYLSCLIMLIMISVTTRSGLSRWVRPNRWDTWSQLIFVLLMFPLISVTTRSSWSRWVRPDRWDTCISAGTTRWSWIKVILSPANPLKFMTPKRDCKIYVGDKILICL